MPQTDFWPFTSNKAINDLDENGENSSLLKKKLGDMEGEVKEIQMELETIRRDRLDLFNRKQPKELPSDAKDIVSDTAPYDDASKLTDENYQKFLEISKLREDLIRTKNLADKERLQRQKYEAKLKDLEAKLNSIYPDLLEPQKEEHRKHSDEEISALKYQIRDMKEEIEEMKLTLSEKDEQVQGYRVKYLQAQQQVEELRRQLDVIDFDNKQVSDQIQIEIQKMKMQFQEKLQELAPLPDLLKGAQIQLQEAKQFQNLAEENSHQLATELHRVKEKLVMAVNNFNQEKHDRIKTLEENNAFRIAMDENQKQIEELCQNMDDYKCQVLRLQEKLTQQELRYKEKSSECADLMKELDLLRAENTRSLTRSKERADSTRRYLQTQISEMERQLIQSRAQCRACQKERDEIRQRMQIQINNLQENFELVEIRLRGLQNQVTSLKSSYTVILADEGDRNEYEIVAT